jgi:hypothetical protein
MTVLYENVSDGMKYLRVDTEVLCKDNRRELYG